MGFTTSSAGNGAPLGDGQTVNWRTDGGGSIGVTSGGYSPVLDHSLTYTRLPGAINATINVQDDGTNPAEIHGDATNIVINLDAGGFSGTPPTFNDIRDLINNDPTAGAQVAVSGSNPSATNAGSYPFIALPSYTLTWSTFLTPAGPGDRPSQVNAADYISVNVTSPTATAALQVDGTTKGIQFPRMTTTQKNAIANTAGLVVFDTTLGKLCVNTGSAWQTITST